MLAPIQKGTEFHAVFTDFVAAGKAENLKTAAVGQNRLIPPHEGMEAARLAHKPVTGALEQVIGVGKADLRADFRKIAREHGLHGCLCANGHIARRFDDAVGRMKAPEPGAGLLAFVDQFILKILHRNSLALLEEHCIAE